MAEVKKQTAEAFDPWKTPKETWQYITVPDEDPAGSRFPNITINKTAYEAGQTYHLPVAVADFVKERIKTFNRSVTRLFNPKADLEALRVVPVGSAPGGQTNYVDASKITTL
jgi:hypothetical protein